MGPYFSKITISANNQIGSLGVLYTNRRASWPDSQNLKKGRKIVDQFLKGGEDHYYC